MNGDAPAKRKHESESDDEEIGQDVDPSAEKSSSVIQRSRNYARKDTRPKKRNRVAKEKTSGQTDVALGSAPVPREPWLVPLISCFIYRFLR